MEQLCRFFQDPAEHCTCQQGVTYSALAGGAVHYQILRLPCVPISNRKGEVASKCQQYQPEQGEQDGPEQN